MDSLTARPSEKAVINDSLANGVACGFDGSAFTVRSRFKCFALAEHACMSVVLD